MLSCNRNFEQNELIGSWERKNLDSHYGENYSQKTTFTDDSLVYEEFENGKLTNRISTAYKFKGDSNVIHFDTVNNIVDLIVSKSTYTEMELLNVHAKNPMKYKKVK